ncbi:MAG: glycosyltransferase [Candidatus Kapaibacteriota bacterium]
MSVIDLVLTLFFAKTLFFAVGVFRSRRIGSRTYPDNSLTVSIVIPARNEEEHLPKCLESLIQNKGDDIEFIIVNDRSHDSTQDVINAYLEIDKRIKCIELIDERTGNLRGKPGALHAGILESSGDIIMMTDADCTFSTQWVKSVKNMYDRDSIAMIAGFTTISASSVFHHLQDMEWLMNHTLASAGLALGMPLGCFGNNLSIRKSVYEEVGGYPGIPFSVTEDLQLLQMISRSGYEIHYPINANNAVSTMPCPDWKSFVSQQHRWVRGSEALGWKKHLFVVFAVIFWGGLLFSIVHGDIKGIGLMLAMRVACDCLLILPSLHSLKRFNQLPWIIPGMLFMIFIEIMVAILLLKKDVQWKGQTFR